MATSSKSEPSEGFAESSGAQSSHCKLCQRVIAAEVAQSFERHFGATPEGYICQLCWSLMEPTLPASPSSPSLSCAVCRRAMPDQCSELLIARDTPRQYCCLNCWRTRLAEITFDYWTQADPATDCPTGYGVFFKLPTVSAIPVDGKHCSHCGRLPPEESAHLIHLGTTPKKVTCLDCAREHLVDCKPATVDNQHSRPMGADRLKRDH